MLMHFCKDLLKKFVYSPQNMNGLKLVSVGQFWGDVTTYVLFLWKEITYDPYSQFLWVKWEPHFQVFSDFLVK